jgi:hypothetical protein
VAITPDEAGTPFARCLSECEGQGQPSVIMRRATSVMHDHSASETACVAPPKGCNGASLSLPILGVDGRRGACYTDRLARLGWRVSHSVY